jgi:hypothetical protein
MHATPVRAPRFPREPEWNGAAGAGGRRMWEVRREQRCDPVGADRWSAHQSAIRQSSWEDGNGWRRRTWEVRREQRCDPVGADRWSARQSAIRQSSWEDGNGWRRWTQDVGGRQRAHLVCPYRQPVERPARFSKTWQVSGPGGCAWGAGFSLPSPSAVTTSLARSASRLAPAGCCRARTSAPAPGAPPARPLPEKPRSRS